MRNVGYVYPLGFVDVRTLIRFRRKLMERAAGYSNMVSTSLLKLGYTFHMLGGMSDSDVRPTIEDLLDGKKPLQADARSCMSDIPIPEHIQWSVKLLYSLIDSQRLAAKESLSRLDKATSNLLFGGSGSELLPGWELIPLLESIPGVGHWSAMVIASETADLARFQTVKAYQAWCGFDPTLKISAGKVTANVTRKGSSLVQHILTECAHVAINGATPLGEWGRKLAARGVKKAKVKAIKAVARRLGASVFHVWRTKS